MTSFEEKMHAPKQVNGWVAEVPKAVSFEDEIDILSSSSSVLDSDGTWETGSVSSRYDVYDVMNVEEEVAAICEVHEQDTGFQCTNWAKDQHFGHVRDVSFCHPVKVYLGPKASNCQEVQRYRIYQNNHLIVETSQQMNDIPYGDYFRVEGRWEVVPAMNKATPHCVVHVFVDVSFSKKTVWKGKIEQGTYDECKDVYATWLAEAHRLLQEKGLLNNKHTREAVKSKPKRKLDLEPGQVQGHVKMSKNTHNSSSNQMARSGQSKQPLQGQPFKPTTILQHPPQLFSLANLTSVSQGKLLFVIFIMAVFLLIQTGIIIALSRSSKTQYVPLNHLRWGECHDSLNRHCGRQDVAMLQQSTQLLWEEINIVEARLKGLQHSLDFLRINLNLAEKIPSEKIPSPPTG
ncbi:hypothetical protein L7F22_057788 [Adiantum nelumboides]|nr:hypothetical protein [Adiantum nelumboides]